MGWGGGLRTIGVIQSLEGRIKDGWREKVVTSYFGYVRHN